MEQFRKKKFILYTIKDLLKYFILYVWIYIPYFEWFFKTIHRIDFVVQESDISENEKKKYLWY